MRRRAWRKKLFHANLATFENADVATHDNVDDDDWVIGDWGYRKNLTERAKPAEDQNSAIVGENVIYLGDGKWYGLPGGIKTAAEWETEIQGWNPGNTGEPELSKHRDFSSFGLRKVP